MLVAIIGCGNMGSALAGRLSKTHQLYFYDHHIEKAEKLEQEGYGKVCRDIKEATDLAELIILAVKPQNIKEVGNLILGGSSSPGLINEPCRYCSPRSITFVRVLELQTRHFFL